MAYVGTPSYRGDNRTTLASIIAGEASGQGLVGQQAVAQVIQNRAAINFSGYGNDVISQALARNQFQGQAAPTAQSYQVADQLLSGQLPNVVGSGAVNYANPGASSAAWARNLDSSNSYQLGAHYFTDNTNGRPYSPTDIGSPMNSNNPTGTTGGSGLGNGYQTTINPDGTASSTFPEISDGPLGTGSPVAGGGSPNATGRAASNAQSQSQSGSQTSTQSSSGGGGSAGGSFTVPQAIDTQTRGNAADTKSLNSQSKSNTDALNKTSTANTQSGINAANTLYNSATGSLSDYFVRFVFIIVGIIALVGALMLFSKPKQLIQQVAKAAL